MMETTTAQLKMKTPEFPKTMSSPLGEKHERFSSSHLLEGNLVVLLFFASCQSDPGTSMHHPSMIVRQQVSETQAQPGPGPLSFENAALLALRNNPGLASFDPAMRAADGRILQSSLAPNPTLDTTVENALGSGAYRGFSAAESSVAISQLIERGGKREARRGVRIAEKDLVRADYQIRRQEIFTEVAQAYAQALAAQEKIDLYSEFVTLNESFLPEIEKRIEAGKGTSVERSRAKTAVTTARLARMQAEREFKTARLRLAATWGSVTPGFHRVAGKLGDLPKRMDQDSLERRLYSHPSYRKEEGNVVKSSAEHRLAIANGKQDITIQGGPKYFSEGRGEAALVIGFSIPLPFNDKNQGEIAATEAEIEVAEREKEAAFAVLKAELNTAFQTLSSARTEAETIQDELLPGAQEAFDGVQEGYSKGRFGYLDLIDARRSLTEAKVQLLDAKAAYQEAAAEISGLTSPLP